MTDVIPVCPTRDELEAFLQLGPAVQEGSPLEPHVNTCPAC